MPCLASGQWLFKDQFICVQISYAFSEVNVKKPLLRHSFHTSDQTDGAGEPPGLPGLSIGKKRIRTAPGTLVHVQNMGRGHASGSQLVKRKGPEIKIRPILRFILPQPFRYLFLIMDELGAAGT
jgi:hypothetical protein